MCQLIVLWLFWWYVFAMWWTIWWDGNFCIYFSQETFLKRKKKRNWRWRGLKWSYRWKVCQASDHSSWLCFNICKPDTTRYLKETVVHLLLCLCKPKHFKENPHQNLKHGIVTRWYRKCSSKEKSCSISVVCREALKAHCQHLLW